MPTYGYKCANGHEKEQQRSVKDRDNIAICEVCFSWMTRLPAAPAFALKGSGFYVNDHPKPRETQRDTTT